MRPLSISIFQVPTPPGELEEFSVRTIFETASIVRVKLDRAKTPEERREEVIKAFKKDIMEILEARLRYSFDKFDPLLNG